MIFEKTEHSRRARENDESSLSSLSLSLSLSLSIYLHKHAEHSLSQTYDASLAQKYYLEEKWAFISF